MRASTPDADGCRPARIGHGAPPDPCRSIARRRLIAACGYAWALPALPAFGQAAQAAPAPCAGLPVLDERETRFGRLAVVERGRRRYLAYCAAGQFVYQSAIDLDRPLELAARYMRLMMLGIVYADPCERIVQIGVGAGNMAGYVIRNFPDVVVHAIDIDPHAVELGMRWFGLEEDPRLKLEIADGVAWLEAARGPFDVVMLDAYDDDSVPAPLQSPAFFALVASRLSPQGVAVQNLYLPAADPKRFVESLRSAFDQVDVYLSGSSAVLAAYQGRARRREALVAKARALDASLRPPHSLAGALDYRARGL